MIVDLPAPLGPTRATRSPAATLSDTSCSTGLASSPLPWAKLTAVMSSAIGPASAGGRMPPRGAAGVSSTARICPAAATAAARSW